MNNLQALKTLTIANIRRILRIWIQTIIPPAMTTALYFLIFGQLIGKRIGEMPGYEGPHILASPLFSYRSVVQILKSIVLWSLLAEL